MNQTSNYQLNQWDPEDRILRTDFNEDNAKLDAALKGNADAISSEASARSSAVSSLTNLIGQRGNCKMEIRTYIGTGQDGETHPCSQTFSRKPAVIFITGDEYLGICLRNGTTIWNLYSKYANICYCSWSADGKTVSWYAFDADVQLNTSGMTYTLVALFDCDE